MEYVFYFKDKSNGVDIVQKQATCEWAQIPLEAIILFSRSVMVVTSAFGAESRGSNPLERTSDLGHNLNQPE